MKHTVSVTLPLEVLEPLGGDLLPASLTRAAVAFNDRDLARAEALLREHLLSPDNNASARAAFAFLLHVLDKQGKSDAAAEAFRAPWSPLGDEQSGEFDRRYAEAIAATGSEGLPLKRRLRFRELVRLLESTRAVAGEVAECGCYRGLSSHLLCQTLAAESPRFEGAGYHIFDSFCGLSDPMPEDAVPEAHPNREPLLRMTQAGAFAAPLDTVRRNLARFPAIGYHPGWIPESFASLAERRYRFVHLDVDLYDPTRDSLEYFLPRMAAGGAIVSDDYSWPGARRAIEEFCAERGVRFAVTEFEQALIRL